MVAERDAPTKQRRRRVSRRPRCEICPNCGHPIAVNYCPNCGQHAADHNSSIWSFVAEFFDEFLQVDSKFLRTLGALVRRPGFLTQEWVNGKRASYISPLKLYIAVNALFFLAVTFKIPPPHGRTGVVNFSSLTPTEQKLVADQAKKSGAWEDRLASDLVSRIGNTDPAVVQQEFISHLSTASLILIPFMTLVFSALYIRWDRYYLEHLVFLLHVNSFCFATLGLALFVPWGWVIPLVLLWHCIYAYMAMKRNYEQGWVKTFFKFWLFGIAFFWLAIAAVVVTAVTAALMAPRSTAIQSTSPGNSTNAAKATTSKPPLSSSGGAKN